MAASMVGHQPLLCLVQCRALCSLGPGAVETLSYACINPFICMHELPEIAYKWTSCLLMGWNAAVQRLLRYNPQRAVHALLVRMHVGATS
jgi:hypothetical protein